MNVECGEDDMQLSLERNHFLQFDVNLLHLRYKFCNATGINATHVWFHTPLNDCGTSHNESSNEIIYWNEVQADSVVVGGVVSRMHDIYIPFYCAYSKKKLVSAVSYKPEGRRWWIFTQLTRLIALLYMAQHFIIHYNDRQEMFY